MTNKSLNLKNRPFLLHPTGKDYLWGGTRLKEEFHKDIPMTPLAESWECSTHPAGISTVVGTEMDGMRLSDVLALHPEYLGTHPKTDGGLPIMVKLIDAAEDLSIQVHPDDEAAARMEQGSLGKSEMWYVLDALPDSRLIYGFYRDMEPAQLRKSLADGTVLKYLQKVDIQKNDVFFIEAGTVHAIGAGALVVEIQECSDITYRMFDYNRYDKNGKKRELQIEKAMQVINLKGSTQPRQPMRVLKYRRGYASEFLCRCKYFEVERVLLNTDSCGITSDFCAGENSFQILLCTKGSGSLNGEETHIVFREGDCIFIPANSINLRLQGTSELLKISC